jgi:hypothetical protein
VEFLTDEQQISVGWTLRVSVDNGVAPLVGANVDVVDDLGATVASGTTDGAGLFSEVLTAYDETSPGRNYRAPMRVRAEFNGTADSTTVPLDSTTTVQIVLPTPTAAPLPGPLGALGISAFPSVTPGSTQFRLSRALRFEGAVEVYDLRGRAVRRIAIPAGATSVAWDGRDRRGRKVGAGVYLARVERAGQVASCRIVVVR